MHTIEEMQNDMKNTGFTMSVLKITENHMTVAVYGQKSKVNAFVALMGKLSHVKQDFIITQCKKMNLRVRAEERDIKGVVPSRRFNRIAEKNDINADENWDVVFGYILKPQSNLLDIPQDDLDNFWKYADFIFYNQMLPSVQGS